MRPIPYTVRIWKLPNLGTIEHWTGDISNSRYALRGETGDRSPLSRKDAAIILKSLVGSVGDSTTITY